MASRPWAMILAAGFGKRLSPLSEIRPKPALDLGATPIIYHLLRMLIKAGINDVIINLHYLAPQLELCLADFKGDINIHLSFEKNILGTAGGVSKAINNFNVKNKPLLVMHGDILCDVNLGSFIYENNNYCSLLCIKNWQIAEYLSNIKTDENNQITNLGRFYQSSKQVAHQGFFSGIHLLSARAVEDLRNNQQSCLVSEVYPTWLKEGKQINAFMDDCYYDDLGSLTRLYDSNLAILDDNFKAKHLDIFYGLKSYNGLVKSYVGEKLVIADDVELIPPFIIGHNVLIEQGASIGPYAIIGSKSRLKSNAKVTNSVVMSDTVVEKNERIDCTLALIKARVLVKDRN